MIIAQIRERNGGMKRKIPTKRKQKLDRYLQMERFARDIAKEDELDVYTKRALNKTMSIRIH